MGPFAPPTWRRCSGLSTPATWERLLGHLAAGDGAALLDEVAALDERAPDYGAVLDEVMASLKHLAVVQLLGSDPRRENTARPG